MSPEWITAIATVATALLTGTGGVATWLALRREGRRQLPIIEFDLSRRATGEALVDLRIRNRLDETLVLTELAVVRPRGALASNRFVKTADGRRGEAVAGTASKLSLNVVIGPEEDRSHIPGFRPSYLQTFTLWPPERFLSGQSVELSLRFSSKALTIRDKRIVIKNSMPAAIAMQTDEKANISG